MEWLEKYLLTIFVLLAAVNLQAQITPSLSFLDEISFSDTSKAILSGPARIISFDGRKGINTTSIRSVYQIKHHTLNNEQGSVSLWFLPLDDLCHFPFSNNLIISNKNAYMFPLLSDNPNPQNFSEANFKLGWDAGWHPNLLALFAKGNYYEDAFNLPHRACVSSNHAAFKRNKWYQITLTWNYPKDEYALYINGILVGREDQFRDGKFFRNSINRSLFLGNPSLVFSNLDFYDVALTTEEVYKLFHNQVTRFDHEIERQLQYMYNGIGRETLVWEPDETWKKEFEADLTNPLVMDAFYIQGKPVFTGITKDGLLIETVNKCMNRALLDSQMYLWTKKVFEGDLYVEYEFNSLRPGGLSLLMVQASGICREDFMLDYPLRTSGRMTTVYGEDIRNYHWEYYRDMADTRNDVLSSGLVKNPFTFPMSYGCLDKPLEKNRWHKLQFLQIENKIVGAIDGIIMVAATDNGFSNHGSVYNFGHIAIRCMLHSKMLFRNLKIYNRTPLKTETFLNSPF